MTPERREQLRTAAAFAMRLTAAGAGGLTLAQLLQVRLPLWVALTAMVVTQTSIGRSLKTTFDYLGGTLIGALWGAVVAILAHLACDLPLIVTLATALAPMAFASALDPRLTAAPVTAAIVILVPQITHLSPVASALERVWEVALGGVTGLAVSFLLMPASAFNHARQTASAALAHMAKAAQELLAGLQSGLGLDEVHRIQDGIGKRIAEFQTLTAEAERERQVRIGGEPTTAPLLRTLLRLRHDLVMLGRAAGMPLPPAIHADTLAPLGAVGRAVGGHLQSAAEAILQRRPAPAGDAVDDAVADLDRALDRLRSSGVLRTLPSDEVEGVFALSFVLEQMRRNLHDLDRCLDEWAGTLATVQTKTPPR